MKYQFDSGRKEYHVWQDNWGFDQFERLTPEQFHSFQAVCREWPSLLPLVEADD